MSGKALPAVLRTDTLERPENQDLNTDILRPVNFSQQGCKFVFEKKGILDSNSQLQIAQIVVDSTQPAVNTSSVLPTDTGAMAMIKRAFLTIGGKRVSNLDDVGHFGTWRRLHFSNEYKKGVAMVKQGGNDVFVGSASRTIAGNSATAINARGFAAPYGTLGRESSEYSINSDAAASFGLPEDAKSDTRDKKRNHLTNDASTTPNWVVGLSQIIPFLVGVQLPLFAIKEEVALNIEWADNTFGHRFYPPQSVSVGGVPTAIVATNCTSTMVENRCLIMADYLFYPELMGELAEEIMSRGGYDIGYDEFLTQMGHTTYITGDMNNEYQLAMAGKRVKAVIVQKELVDAANESINNIGRYNSLGLKNGVEPQLNIDAKNWYSQPLSNQSLQKSCADQVEGVPLQLCDYRWSWINQQGAGGLGLSNRLVNTYPNAAAAASQKWIGIKLENAYGQGVRVSNLPMIYSEKVNVDATQNNQSRRVRFYVKTQRLLNISAGLVNMIE